MTLTLVGMGCGSAATLTEEGRQALLQADLLIGAARLLENLPERCTSRRRAAVRTEEILELQEKANGKKAEEAKVAEADKQ